VVEEAVQGNDEEEEEGEGEDRLYADGAREDGRKESVDGDGDEKAEGELREEKSSSVDKYADGKEAGEEEGEEHGGGSKDGIPLLEKKVLILRVRSWCIMSLVLPAYSSVFSHYRWREC